jgi:putative hydrolase of the HAD superfamily
MLAGLHANYRLLLLSNTDAIHYGWIVEKYPIMRHFDHCVLSFELGLRKPEPGIYQEAIRQSQCAPAEIFFTDDIAENIAAARLAGIDAVQFQSLEQLEGELTSRGIRW